MERHPLEEEQRPAAEANASTRGSNLMLPPAFVEDPARFLNQIASQPPSRQGMAALAGPIAKWFVTASPRKSVVDSAGDDDTTASSIHPAVHVASHYLRAAAVQLRENAPLVADMEQEMAKTKNQYEVLEAVGAAATLCPNRAGIACTGILPSLAQLMLHAQSSADITSPAAVAAASSRPSLTSSGPHLLSSTAASYPTLQQAGVEFLQC
ncbi:MAG: hypothetical protein SGILL_008001, partial [Bacillariaceae sp.]